MPAEHPLDALLRETRSNASLYHAAAERVEDPSLRRLLLDLQQRHRRIVEALSLRRQSEAGTPVVEPGAFAPLAAALETLRQRLAGASEDDRLALLEAHEGALIDAYQASYAQAEASLQALLGLELPKLREARRQLHAARQQRGAGDSLQNAR